MEFVRGRAQLSLGGMYEGTPQGHLISAKEACDNYGLEVLEEAVENGSALLLKEPNAAGNAIRRQRQSLGLTMEQAARYTAYPGNPGRALTEIHSRRHDFGSRR